MARRYQREELLRLRASPLVEKPANLPPLEEWMGTQPDHSQNSNQKRVPNRGKPEDSSNENNANRRPTFESRISRNNVSEDIVLGPPKTAFASAGRSRADNRTVDSPGRATFTASEETAKTERQSFTDKFSRDAARENRDGLREGRPENLRVRRDDNERWSNARGPRTPYDENERAFRRNNDRDLGRENNGRDAIKGGRGIDNYRRTGDREGNGDDRRNGQGRGRHEPSWYREDEKLETEGHDSTKDRAIRDWRDKDRGAGRVQDRDWARKKDREPEWMDDPKSEEKEPAHTQEDFQKWKERMKAGNAATQDTPASPEPKSNHDRTASSKLKGKLETPLVLDSNFDGFFGMWGDTKKDTITSGADEQPKKTSGKPSKFTGFFAPKAESKLMQDPPQSAPLPAEPSKDEDKEGFQRILKLLDQQQSSNSRNMTPFHEQPTRHPPNSPPQPLLQESNPLEALLNPQPKEPRPPPQSRDSEFLLQLMQQPQQSRPTQQVSSPPPLFPTEIDQRGGAPGLLPFSNLMISSRDNAQQPAPSGFPPGFFPEEKTQRKPGPQQAFFDRPVPADNAVPPGLQRPPPGLDHFAPQAPPQQQQRAPMMQPPPGLPPLMRGPETMRGPNPNAFPPPPVMGGPPGAGAGPGDRGVQGPTFGGRPPPGLFPMGAAPGFMQHGFAEGGFGRGPMDGGFGDFGGRTGAPGGGGYQR